MYVSVWLFRTAGGGLLLSEKDPGEFAEGAWSGFSGGDHCNCEMHVTSLPAQLFWDIRPGKKARANIKLEAA